MEDSDRCCGLNSRMGELLGPREVLAEQNREGEQAWKLPLVGDCGNGVSEGAEEGRGQRGALSCGAGSARCLEELRLHQLVDWQDSLLSAVRGTASLETRRMF